MEEFFRTPVFCQTVILTPLIILTLTGQIMKALTKNFKFDLFWLEIHIKSAITALNSQKI